MTIEELLHKEGFPMQPSNRITEGYTLAQLYQKRDEYQRLYSRFVSRKSEPNIRHLVDMYESNIRMYNTIIKLEEQQIGDH